VEGLLKMIGKPEELVRWLFNQDKEKVFEIKEHKLKRSLNANAYCWVLMNKIADAIKSTKEEVYREYIKNKGIFRLITMNKEATDTFIRVWQEKGLGWICDTSESKYEGMVDVVAYYGTSSYNTKQMANFIDYVVDEAKNLGIETLPPDEIERLKSLWC
jgi:hypothetical protein